MKTSINKALRKYLPFVILIILTGWIIYDADLGRDNFLLSLSEKVPFGDKLGHFLVFGLMCYLLNHALDKRTVKIGHFNIYLAPMIVLIGALVEEFSQIAFKERHFELLDMIFDLLGVVCFTVLYNLKELLIQIPESEWKIIKRNLTKGLY